MLRLLFLAGFALSLHVTAAGFYYAVQLQRGLAGNDRITPSADYETRLYEVSSPLGQATLMFTDKASGAIVLYICGTGGIPQIVKGGDKFFALAVDRNPKFSRFADCQEASSQIVELIPNGKSELRVVGPLNAAGIYSLAVSSKGDVVAYLAFDQKDDCYFEARDASDGKVKFHSSLKALGYQCEGAQARVAPDEKHFLLEMHKHAEYGTGKEGTMSIAFDGTGLTVLVKPPTYKPIPPPPPFPMQILADDGRYKKTRPVGWK